MSKDDKRALSNNRRRRGVVRAASITRLEGSVAELERKYDGSPQTASSAQRLLQKLDELAANFKSYHFAIVDLVEESALESEQTTLDEHDDRVLRLTARVQQLLSKSPDQPSPQSDGSDRRHLSKRLTYVQRNLHLVEDAVKLAESKPDVDTCLLHQHEQWLGDPGQD